MFSDVLMSDRKRRQWENQLICANHRNSAYTPYREDYQAATIRQGNDEQRLQSHVPRRGHR